MRLTIRHSGLFYSYNYIDSIRDIRNAIPPNASFVSAYLLNDSDVKLVWKYMMRDDSYLNLAVFTETPQVMRRLRKIDGYIGINKKMAKHFNHSDFCIYGVYRYIMCNLYGRIKTPFVAISTWLAIF